MQSRNFLDCMTLEDGTDKLFRNVGKYVPIKAALHLSRVKTSYFSPKKPKRLVMQKTNERKILSPKDIDVKMFCQFELKKPPPYSSFYITGLITLPRANCYCVSSSLLYSTDGSGYSLFSSLFRFISSSFYVTKHIPKLLS
jgi:hypothetical protein